MSSIVFDLIEEEKYRQENEVCLIASENYVSADVLKAQGSILTNKYAEGYPGKRYYGGCNVVDKIEQYAIDKCKELFKCKWANVQPHSGSQANQAVYNALLNPGDKILSMSLDAGGHLTHGAKVSSTGKLYNVVHYGLDENGFINYEEIKNKLYEYNPRIVVAGASAYPRIIDFERIRKIVDEYNEKCTYEGYKNYLVREYDNKGMARPQSMMSFYNSYCYLMVDMAHIAGLVATGYHVSPLLYADVVTSTTHKTLRGPRGGIIVSNNEELGKKIDKSVFPGIQGGPLLHIIAAKAICFEEALQENYENYIKQVLFNIKAFEKVFNDNNIKMISGGSDNHLLLLDLRDTGVTGRQLEEALQEKGIIVNKNKIQNDPLPATECSGIRLGTAAVTTMGYTCDDCVKVAEEIVNTIKHLRERN
jgi:glycine hydroxymethyltransferase